MIKLEKLLFWLDKRYNVLLEGKHGIGKSAIVLKAFEKAGLRYAYFSGSTMDPFIDFCGVPIKIEGPNGITIELIRPKHIAEGDIQAIFIDEYNRAHIKIRNAVMELIQFKTINGKPISSDLRVVWASINPDNPDGDGIYDTERLDPAQKDRFQIQQVLPYECDLEYFSEKYGPEIAKAALQYWNDLPESTKDLVSPRRLDYSLQVWQDGGDVRDSLPKVANPSRLVSILAAGPADTKLRLLLGKDEEAKKFLANENNFSYSLKTILANKQYMNAFVPLFPAEKITALFTQEPKIKAHIIADLSKNKKASVFVKTLVEVALANQNSAIAANIRDELDKIGISSSPQSVDVFYFEAVKSDEQAILSLLPQIKAKKNTYYRVKAYDKLTKMVGEQLTTEAAKAIIKVSDSLSACNQKTIDRSMPNLVKIGNHALLQLFENGMSYDDVLKFVGKHPAFLRRRSVLASKTGEKIRLDDVYRYARAQAQVKASQAKLAAAIPSVPTP